MLYALPGSADAKIQYKSKYDNFIGGKWVAPVKGEYFDVITPITGKAYTRPPAPPPKTSNWPWTPPTPPPTSGAAPRPASAPTCC
jgi:hypothetical protein